MTCSEVILTKQYW